MHACSHALADNWLSCHIMYIHYIPEVMHYAYNIRTPHQFNYIQSMTHMVLAMFHNSILLQIGTLCLPKISHLLSGGLMTAEITNNPLSQSWELGLLWVNTMGHLRNMH